MTPFLHRSVFVLRMETGKHEMTKVNQKYTYSFTQADVDAVLYGYLRAHSDADMPLHSISGIKFIPYQYPQGICMNSNKR